MGAPSKPDTNVEDEEKSHDTVVDDEDHMMVDNPSNDNDKEMEKEKESIENPTDGQVEKTKEETSSSTPNPTTTTTTTTGDVSKNKEQDSNTIKKEEPAKTVVLRPSLRGVYKKDDDGVITWEGKWGMDDNAFEEGGFVSPFSYKLVREVADTAEKNS